MNDVHTRSEFGILSCFMYVRYRWHVLNTFPLILSKWCSIYCRISDILNNKNKIGSSSYIRDLLLYSIVHYITVLLQCSDQCTVLYASIPFLSSILEFSTYVRETYARYGYRILSSDTKRERSYKYCVADSQRFIAQVDIMTFRENSLCALPILQYKYLHLY